MRPLIMLVILLTVAALSGCGGSSAPSSPPSASSAATPGPTALASPSPGVIATPSPSAVPSSKARLAITLVFTATTSSRAASASGLPAGATSVRVHVIDVTTGLEAPGAPLVVAHVAGNSAPLTVTLDVAPSSYAVLCEALDAASAPLGMCLQQVTVLTAAPAAVTVDRGVTIAALQLSPVGATILATTNQQFTAVAQFSDQSSLDLTHLVSWGTSDSATATINPDGLASGNGVGTTIISAAFGASTARTPLTVTSLASLASLAIAPTNPTIAAGTRQSFTVVATLVSGVTQDVTSSAAYTSSSPTIATVDAGGVATALAAGTTTITATLGGRSAAAVLTVTPAALLTIDVTPPTSTVSTGSTVALVATGHFADGSSQDLTSQVVWSSATPSVATVSSRGLATAVSPGSSTISATLGRITGTASLSDIPGFVERGPDPYLNTLGLKTPVSGRVTSILPLSASRYLIAAAGGGVWLSTDGGQSWSPRSDGWRGTVMGILAQDPRRPQVIYAGTGEANGSTDSYAGVGIYQSTDNGDTWTFMTASAIFEGTAMSRIVVDPANSLHLLAGNTSAVGGGSGHNFGLYESNDGGASWTAISINGMTSYKVEDIAISAGSAGAHTLLVSVLDKGIYRSTRGTAGPWTLVTLPQSSSVTRISLATTAVNPAIFYALVGNSTGGFDGLYGSNDSGKTWKYLADVGNGSTLPYFDILDQSYYNNILAVSPTDASTLYVAGIEACRVDGIDIANASLGNVTRLTQGQYLADGSSGSAAQREGSPHSDIHALAFDPNGQLLLGGDGGISVLPSPATVADFVGGASYWTPLNGGTGSGLATIEFYGVASSPDGTLLWGGSQDNGSAAYTGSLAWRGLVSGDGSLCYIDPSNLKVVWAEEDSVLKRSVDGQTFSVAESGISNSEKKAQNLPLSGVANTTPALASMLTARQSIYQTSVNTLASVKWTNISHGALLTGGEAFVSVVASHADPSVIIAGSSLGKVFLRSSAAGSFQLRASGLPAQSINGIDTDAVDSNQAWVAVGTGAGGHVFGTTDQGATWTNLSGDLPDIPAYAVRKLGSTLYVGTLHGLFYSVDGGAHWSLVTSVPSVPVLGLEVIPLTARLLVATHGRGAWTGR